MPFFGFIDRPKKFGKISGLVDGPKPRESLAESLNVAFGQQSYGNDAFVRHWMFLDLC